MPGNQSFGPLENRGAEHQKVYMTVDEYETIRLIDLGGLTQEACAEQMEVSRTTAQAIYNNARVKLAECLVGGKQLFIEGGSYVLCEEGKGGFGCARCRRKGQWDDHKGDEGK